LPTLTASVDVTDARWTRTTSRGDWTPIELFGAVVEAWDHHLHEFLAAA